MTIDELLDDVWIPTSSAEFDVAAGLRRLAADTTRPASPELERGRQAQHTLLVLSSSVLNQPGSAGHLAHLADDIHPVGPAEERVDIIDGTVVFACLLYLGGQAESAQFWWQLAAGAGSRTAAYCLHLHHQERGEPREARLWYLQASEPTDTGTLPLADVIGVLEGFARYARRNRWLHLPTESLEAEIDRLAARSRNCCGIVERPDRRLAQRLQEVASHR